MSRSLRARFPHFAVVLYQSALRQEVGLGAAVHLAGGCENVALFIHVEVSARFHFPAKSISVNLHNQPPIGTEPQKEGSWPVTPHGCALAAALTAKDLWHVRHLGYRPRAVALRPPQNFDPLAARGTVARCPPSSTREGVKAVLG